MNASRSSPLATISPSTRPCWSSRVNDLLAFAFDVGAEHDAVAELLGSPFGAGDDVGVHRVGDARDEHAHRPGAGHAQPAGDDVGPVVELAHGVDDPLAGLRSRLLPWDRR